MTSLFSPRFILFLCLSIFSVLAVDLEQSVNSTTTTTKKPIVSNNLVSVCDICKCSANEVNCSNLKLNTNLNEHKWPNKTLNLVTFENNQITQIKPFPKAVIKKLTFRNNKIAKIYNQSFKQLINLTELDLSQNLLSYENFMPQALEGRYSPEAYEPLEKLKVLNLSSNQFHTLNHDLFEHVEDLKTLILSNNPFSVFDESSTIAISGIPYLEELNLSRCQLKNLDESTLHSLRYLKKLDVSGNEFTKLPNALQQSTSLQSLILDDNPIEILDSKNAFPHLKNLKQLSMCNMSKLTSIKKYSLSNLEALEVLVIENCPKLTEISEGTFVKHPEVGGATWPTLKTLNISNNALRYLPATLVARWDKLEELHLMNNQWNCDCDNQYLIGILLPERGVKLMNDEVEKLTCSAPPEHFNKTLKSLAGRHLRCQDTYGARPERDAAILIGMLIGVLLALPIVLGFFILWRRGFFFCGTQGPASFSRAFYKRAPPYDDDI